MFPASITDKYIEKINTKKGSHTARMSWKILKVAQKAGLIIKLNAELNSIIEKITSQRKGLRGKPHERYQELSAFLSEQEKKLESKKESNIVNRVDDRKRA